MPMSQRHKNMHANEKYHIQNNSYLWRRGMRETKEYRHINYSVRFYVFKNMIKHEDLMSLSVNILLKSNIVSFEKSSELSFCFDLHYLSSLMFC